MFALRRAANPLRSRRYCLRAARTCYTKSDNLSDASASEQHGTTSSFPKQFVSAKYLPKGFLPSQSYHQNCITTRGLCSQVGAKSGGEDEDLEDGFSELDSPASSNAEGTRLGPENDGEIVSISELSDDDAEEDFVEDPNEIDLPDIETDTVADEDSKKRKAEPLNLFNVIKAAPFQNVNSALDKFVKEENSMGRPVISLAMLNLRKRRMYGKALQLSKWLEKNKQLIFEERDYASQLDLIAKVRGLVVAEQYIESIPKSFRGETIYRTLLANCVSTDNVNKAEAVFQKMRKLDFPLTPFACNQLILLYKKLNKKKIADVLLLMEKNDVKPTRFTYKLLIDTKGQTNDITGMEQLVETMKSEGYELDNFIRTTLVKHYIHAGVNEKAEEIVKEMEGEDLNKAHGVCKMLLHLYAGLGKAEEVERIWKVCESNPRIDECLAAVGAWGTVGRVEKAEEVFELMIKTWKKPPAKCYTTLLSVYAKHKLLVKGKDLAKTMASDGYRIDPLAWDSLVKLFVEAGEVEKADSVLQKAIQQDHRMRPMFNSFMVIMEQYSRRGDIHNTEKIFHQMRQSGYVSRIWQYQCLLKAYINAKVPAYGFRDRMKADNVFPNKSVAGQLAQIDTFKKTAISDFLD
ncbi:hypothetical protein MKW94_014064 [Papaver nudicaule]|uniref:Pentatricopeptide repeat-containing protein n=1 Tax=Papaver nudicaule TaxID=74823 RepID=A0AA41SMF3_PAPNU|nr:hypothetical protein [Papaver nudicaule]